MNNSRRP